MMLVSMRVRYLSIRRWKLIRWGPTQLSNLECQVDSRAHTSQHDNQINRVLQRPEDVHPTNLTEQSSPVLSVSKPWGRLAHEVMVGPDSISFLTAANSNDTIIQDTTSRNEKKQVINGTREWYVNINDNKFRDIMIPLHLLQPNLT